MKLFFFPGGEASRWITRSVNDFRRPPFREPPPMDFHPKFGPDYGQSYRNRPSFTSFNMIPTAPPPFFEFYDPVSGRHHKVHNHYNYNAPAPRQQQYSRSYKLQDASPFPSSYDKKRLRHKFSAPHENSYANDNQFYSDFATKRRKSFLNNAQYSGPFSKGNVFNDNFVFYLLSNWKDYRI